MESLKIRDKRAFEEPEIVEQVTETVTDKKETVTENTTEAVAQTPVAEVSKKQKRSLLWDSLLWRKFENFWKKLNNFF